MRHQSSAIEQNHDAQPQYQVHARENPQQQLHYKAKLQNRTMPKEESHYQAPQYHESHEFSHDEFPQEADEHVEVEKVLDNRLRCSVCSRRFNEDSYVFSSFVFYSH